MVTWLQSKMEIENLTTLPPFANQENRDLWSQIQRYEEELRKLEDNISDQRNRKTLMENHMKNVKLEIEHTKSIKDGKTREIESETHLHHVIYI